MLIVVTSPGDPDLPWLVSQDDVAVVVAQHLSNRGWRSGARPEDGQLLSTSRGLVAGGDIAAMVMRTPRVTAADLPHVAAVDREYVAAEMTAFLAAFAADARCPLFNRPTASCLVGPAWTVQHWYRAAAAAGVPVCVSCGAGSGDLDRFVMLDGEIVGESTGARGRAVPRRVVGLAPVRIARVDLCRRHGALRSVSLRPRLDERLLSAIRNLTATRSEVVQ